MTLQEIDKALENATDETARLQAFGDLLTYLENTVSEFGEAYEIYNKWTDLARDWTQETVSGKQK